MNENPIKMDEGKTEIDVFTLENPTSVVNMVSPRVKEWITQHSFTNPEYFNIEERELRTKLKLKRRGQGISPTENRLRLSFWAEYHRTLERGASAMHMTSVYSGVCTKQLFLDSFIKDPCKVAWMLLPPPNYAVLLEEAYSIAVDQMRHILSMDPEKEVVKWTKDGKKKVERVLDVRLASLQAQIYDKLDQRRHGAYTQRIEQKTEQKTLHVTSKVDMKDAPKEIQGDELKFLEHQMKELEKKERDLDPIIVPVEKDDGE